MRLIDESINNAQANCVDGSVLLASLLRKIDIEPVLVYVPGHCYLAFYLDAEQKHLVGLETTLIGSTPDDDASREIAGVRTWSTPRPQAKLVGERSAAAIAMGNADLEPTRTSSTTRPTPIINWSRSPPPASWASCRSPSDSDETFESDRRQRCRERRRHVEWPPSGG